MERNNVQRQNAYVMRKSLFDQGYLDEYWKKKFFDQGYLDEQFIQLADLQDDANPNFVEEIVTSFYNDSARVIRNVEMSLENIPLDFNKLDHYMHQFKGSSSSIGAKKADKECAEFQDYCKARNAEGCKRTFQLQEDIPTSEARACNSKEEA